MQPDKKKSIYGWTISRYSFYFVVTGCSFVWFWFPDYISRALSLFNWTTWIAPDNLNLATITGEMTGLGLNPIASFDWNVTSYSGPLYYPFYYAANSYIGSLLGLSCICALWHTNTKWTACLPINSNSLFSNTGDTYSVSEAISSGGVFDIEKYQKNGPPFYTAASWVLYGSCFVAYPFTFIWFVATSWRTIKSSIYLSLRHFSSSTYDGSNDPFSRSMTKYKELPEWAFMCVLVVSIVLAVLCCKLYPTETPIWGIFFALRINLVAFIPFTLIYSMTALYLGLDVLVELIIGTRFQAIARL